MRGAILAFKGHPYIIIFCFPFFSRIFIRQNPKLTKAQSTPNLDGSFLARPFPSHIFTGYAYQKMKANLEYRETQKQIRQKALLESASLPPRMQQLQKSENELKKILKSAKNKVRYCWDQNTGLVQYLNAKLQVVQILNCI